jgi:hypothetical protein
VRENNYKMSASLETCELNKEMAVLGILEKNNA